MTHSDLIKSKLKFVLRAERAMGIHSVRGSKRIGKTELISTAHPTTVPISPSTSSKHGGMKPKADSVETRPPAKPEVLNLEPITGDPLPRSQKLEVLSAMDRDEVKGCRKCRLSEGRTNTVFGVGDVDAQLMFIGEGPGENEDLQGEPFVGRAGELLNKMISAMGLSRESVYITNIVKCRPPGNRAPMPEETQACTPYLVRQIEVIRPRVIVTLGLPATQYLLQSKDSMSRLRGRWHWWRGIKLMPTYHPAYVLRSYTKETRAAVWSDLQKVMDELDIKNRPGNTSDSA